LKKSTAAIISITTVVICLLGVAYAVYSFLAPNNKMVPAFEEGRLNVVVGGSVVDTGTQPRIEDGEILLPYDLIRKYIDPGIYWDKDQQKVTVTTRDRVIRMKTGSLDAFVNNKPVSLNIPVSLRNGEVFVPIAFLSDFYNISMNLIKLNNVIVIDFNNTEKKLAEPLKENTPVRKGQSIHFPIFEKLGSGKDFAVRVFSESEEWYGVRTFNGVVGYVQKDQVSVKTIPADKPQKAEPVKDAWKPQKGKINLVWDYTWGGRPDLSKRTKIEGLDVVSPTSFQVIAEDGTIKNRADAKYIDWAHGSGYKVWALFSNNFGDADKASRFLRNTDARDNAIRQLLAFSALYKLDGINIDIEELPDSDRDALTQFVKEASILFREQGLVVSVDVNTKGLYDREALAECVDYVALMAYDQHWAGGKVAGSVAEIPWVEDTVERFLKTVPAEKLLLGIPFYTRVWKEEKAEDGSVKLTSQALSMEAARKALNENKASVTLDTNSNQFYAEYVKDGSNYKVWLEDINSVDLRTSLVQKYGLAGAAAWRKDFETEDVWDTLNRNLKTITTFSEWESKTKGMARTYQR
jgi:spore germination protein YaaH